jgi:hypothetical protein
MHLHRVTPNPFENYSFHPDGRFLGTTSDDFRASTLHFEGQPPVEVVVAHFPRFGDGKRRKSDFDVFSNWTDIERMIDKFCEAKHPPSTCSAGGASSRRCGEGGRAGRRCPARHSPRRGGGAAARAFCAPAPAGQRCAPAPGGPFSKPAPVRCRCPCAWRGGRSLDRATGSPLCSCTCRRCRNLPDSRRNRGRPRRARCYDRRQRQPAKCR